MTRPPLEDLLQLYQAGIWSSKTFSFFIQTTIIAVDFANIFLITQGLKL